MLRGSFTFCDLEIAIKTVNLVTLFLRSNEHRQNESIKRFSRFLEPSKYATHSDSNH